MPLDADERALLESVEGGEWRSTRGFARQQTEYARRASATFREDRRINIGISSKDLGFRSAQDGRNELGDVRVNVHCALHHRVRRLRVHDV